MIWKRNTNHRSININWYQLLHTSIAPLYQNLRQGAKAGGKLFKAPGRAGMWLWQLLISLKGSQRCGALSTVIAKNAKNRTVKKKKHTPSTCVFQKTAPPPLTMEMDISVPFLVRGPRGAQQVQRKPQPQYCLYSLKAVDMQVRKVSR